MDLPSSTTENGHGNAGESRNDVRNLPPPPSTSGTEPSLFSGGPGASGAVSTGELGSSDRSSAARDPRRMAEKAAPSSPGRRGRSRTLKPPPAFALDENDDVFALSWPRTSTLDGEPFRKAR